MVLRSDLGTGEMEVVVHHLQGGVTEDFPQGEDVAAVEQVVYGKSVAAEVRM